MKRFRQWTVLSVLAGFLSFYVVELTHHHATIQSEDNCSVCQLVNQTPTLTHTPDLPTISFTVEALPLAAVPHPYLQFVFASHGRSPPAI